MTSRFKLFLKKKHYLTESMQIYWLHILYDYLDEKDTPYSDDSYLWPDCFYQYFNELPLGESIESSYLMWKSEQHRLPPKYDILSSFVTLVKHYFVTMEEDNNQFKITC